MDLLCGGRLNLGFSVGPPSALEEVRVGTASTFSGTRRIEVFSDRVRPHSPGLAQRLWCGERGLGALGR